MPSPRPTRSGVRSSGRAGQAWRKASAQVRAQATHCWLCLEALTLHRWPHPRSTSVHHVIPISQGGPPLDPRNLVATHLGCNLEVGDRIVGMGALAKRSERDRRGLNPSRQW